MLVEEKTQLCNSKPILITSILLGCLALISALFGGKWGTNYAASAGVNLAPHIDYIAPTNIPAGSHDTVVIISGSGFGTSNDTRVRLNGAGYDLLLNPIFINAEAISLNISHSLLISPTVYTITVIVSAQGTVPTFPITPPYDLESNPVLFRVIDYPTLTLVKTVINDNGGSLGVQDFPLFIDDIPAISGEVYKQTIGTHTASELQMDGYQGSDWGGDCASDGSITLSEGDESICTINNTDIQPKLTLVKTVINNYFGNRTVEDFPLFINNIPAISGYTYGLDAGPYITSETQLPGYTASDWGGHCMPDGSITLIIGENKICTITNLDVPPMITYIPIVTK